MYNKINADICEIISLYTARSTAYRLALIIKYSSRLIFVRDSIKYRYNLIDNKKYEYYLYDKKYITIKYISNTRNFKSITYSIYGFKFSVWYYYNKNIYNGFSYALLQIGNNKYILNMLQISENGYMRYDNEFIYYQFANDIMIYLGYGNDHLVYISLSIIDNEYIINERGIYIQNNLFNEIYIEDDISVSYAHLSPNSAKLYHKNGQIMADITYNNRCMISYAIYHENGDVIKKLI